MLLLPRGDGQHRDPRGAQHPDDSGPGLHRHQLGGQSYVSGLHGPDPLPSLEGSPAGLVCCRGGALLPAHRCRCAQLRPAGKPGGVPEGGVASNDCERSRGRGGVSRCLSHNKMVLSDPQARYRIKPVLPELL